MDRGQAERGMEAGGLSATTKPKKTSPRVHALVGLLIVGSLGMAMYRADAATGGQGYAMGRAAGQWVGSLLLAAIVGMVAFWVSRRSNRVFNIAFSLVLGLGLIGNVAGLANQSDRRETRAVLERLQQETAPARERVFEKAGDFDAEGVAVEAATLSESLNRAADDLKGDDAVAVRVAAEAVDYLQRLGAPHTRAMGAFSNKGGISPIGLNEASAGARLEKLAEAERLHAHFRATLAEFPAWLEGRYAAHGMTAAKSKSNAAAYLRGAKFVQILRMHDQTAELLVSFRRIIEFLRDHEGRWTYDQARDGLEFESDADAEAYNGLFERMSEAAEKETRHLESIRGN
ncbi:MAG: hypothetical protein ACK4WH_03190 [Phycisphaerales bacterium]